MGPIGIAGMQAASDAVNMGMGMALSKWEQKQQREQARWMQNLQIGGQQTMGKFNQGLALEMWDKTNYDAQVKQLEKAGLNVGLMYGMGGAGGATTNTPTGQVMGQQANPQVKGMGMQLGIAELSLLKSQKENIEADTILKLKEAGYTGGPRSEQSLAAAEAARAAIPKTEQETINLKKSNEILELERQLREINVKYEGRTLEDRVQAAYFAANKLAGEAQQEVVNGKLSQEGYGERLEQIKLTTKGMILDQEATRMGIRLTEQEIQKAKMATSEIEASILKLNAERNQSWDKLNYQERQLIVNEALAKMEKEKMDFMTSDPQKYQQWVSLITSVVTLGLTGGSGNTIKGFGR